MSAVAGKIYRYFLKDAKNPVVWDPSGGFGGRLLGFRSCYPSGTYYGNEPAVTTFEDLLNLADRLDGSIGKSVGKTVIFPCGSELDSKTFDPGELVDLVFTSPPYFAKERYFNEDGQCWKDYPTEEEWFKKYVFPTTERAFYMLKSGACLVLNTDYETAEKWVFCANEIGFKRLPDLKLELATDNFGKKRGIEKKSEPILVFQKP